MNSELRVSFITYFTSQKDCSMSNAFYSKRTSWGHQNLAVKILSSILSSMSSPNEILRSISWLLIRP